MPLPSSEKDAMYSSKLAELMANKLNLETEEPEADDNPDLDDLDQPCPGFHNNVVFHEVSDPTVFEDVEDMPLDYQSEYNISAPIWVKYYHSVRKEWVVARGRFDFDSHEFRVRLEDEGPIRYEVLADAWARWSGRSPLPPWEGPVIRGK